jgi:DNA-binding NarL/FixJ family response regulator
MTWDKEGERARILVVDNDPHLRRALMTGVEAAGALAVGASTLREAREALRAGSFAAMILNAVLPDGSGLDLLDELRRQQFHPRALIISGALNAAVANRAHHLGASCVFTPDIAPNVRAFVDRSIASTASAAQRTMAAAREVSAAFGFTAREQQVAELVALGVTRSRLADELGIKENTVKTLVRRTLAKCQEKSLDGLARIVLDEILVLSCKTEPI